MNNDLLDVHHGVGILAGMGLAATAGASSDGHPVLSDGHVAAHRDIQGGVGIKEAKRLQEETHMLGRHDGPVLNPGDVGHPKRVPDHAVSLYQIPILQHAFLCHRAHSQTQHLPCTAVVHSVIAVLLGDCSHAQCFTQHKSSHQAD